MTSLKTVLGMNPETNTEEPIGETLQAIMGVLKSHERAIKGLEEWLGKKTPQATQASYEAHKIAKYMLQTSIDEATESSYLSSKEPVDDIDSTGSTRPKHVLQTSEDRLRISQKYPIYDPMSSFKSNEHNTTHRTPKNSSLYTTDKSSHIERMDIKHRSLKQNLSQCRENRSEDVIKMENLYKQHDDDDVLSTTTEYRELPPHNSTLGKSQSFLVTNHLENSSGGGPYDLVTSTPASHQNSVKRSTHVSSNRHSISSSHNDGHISFHSRQNTSNESVGGGASLKNYSVASLNSKLNILESQVSDWGDVIDELSDRLGNQAVVIRKFVSESLSKKVGVVQYTDDLAALEARIMSAIESKTKKLEKKVDGIHDLLNRINTKTQYDERQFARQDVVLQLKHLLESLSNQCASHTETMDELTRDMDDLRDLVSTVSSDLSFYKHQLEAKNSQSQIMLSLSDHLTNREADVASWKEAIKEVHTALNKQSEINSSLHHSMASLQKKFLAGGNFQYPPYSHVISRWRWVGTSGVYPKTHCCVCEDPHSSSISFVSQPLSSDPSTFSWERNKPYIVVTRPGCYLVMAGAFTRKAGNPPSIQLTIDEDPALLFNSSGKSPTKLHNTIMTSASKHPAVKPKPEGVPPWKTGSTLVGMITLPANCRIGLVTTSTAPSKHGALSVEGILQLEKLD